MSNGNNEIMITWLGHSCFRIEYRGHSIVTDPYTGVPGLPELSCSAGSVYTSHSHDDHAYVRAVRIVEESGESPFSTEEMKSFHDDKGGKLRGENTIRVFCVGGRRIVHFGDIGHLLTTEQISQLGHCDVALIPVGGFYTVDGVGASKIIKALDPPVTIPMHFKKNGRGYDVLGEPDLFIRKLRARKFAEAGGNTIYITDSEEDEFRVRLSDGTGFVLDKSDRCVILPEFRER